VCPARSPTCCSPPSAEPGAGSCRANSRTTLLDRDAATASPAALPAMSKTYGGSPRKPAAAARPRHGNVIMLAHADTSLTVCITRLVREIVVKIRCSMRCCLLLHWQACLCSLSRLRFGVPALGCQWPWPKVGGLPMSRRIVKYPARRAVPRSTQTGPASLPTRCSQSAFKDACVDAGTDSAG